MTADVQHECVCHSSCNEFAGLVWEIPYLVNEMQTARDLYYDVVSQIHMPYWSAGRVAWVGDSAFAPSFMTGRGTSLAMVGAYILAGELASHEKYEKAFANYERIMRPYVKANQDLAKADVSSFVYPTTSEELETRNQALATLKSSEQKSVLGERFEYVDDSLHLPEY